MQVKNDAAATAVKTKKDTAAEGRRYTKKTPAQRKPKTKVNKNPVKITFLGGINEVGKNITLYEYLEDMFIVDCGLAFPEQEMLGVDLVIPDFTYIERNHEKIKGIVITHGHEDHIGALPYLIKQFKFPIYATKLTIGLIQAKLAEHKLLGSVELNVVKPGDKIKLGKFEVECIHVNHSIPDALALAIFTEQGTIIQTGDFKIDSTPIDGEMIDIARLAQIGSEGCLCLLSDSTNAERAGYSESEKKVGESFETLFRKADNKRILVATFASNVHRVQSIIDVACKLKRKVVISGRSLENVVNIGKELGYLNVPEGLIVSMDAINKYPAESLVIITTGSQGEPMSALSRMAFSDHKKVAICPGDYVIISATPIPGNEKTVSRVINELMKLGAEVVYEKMYDVHVSGHACQEELKMIMGIVKPKYFIPVHGEQKHLQKHAALAVSMGINKKNIMIVNNGYVVELTKNEAKFAAPVTAGRVFVDGYGVGDVGSIVLRDRKHLAQDGLVIVVASIDGISRSIVSGPDVVSRGFVYVRESEELIEDAKVLSSKIIYDYLDKNVTDHNTIKTKLKDEITKLMYERTKRNPMVLAILMEV